MRFNCTAVPITVVQCSQSLSNRKRFGLGLESALVFVLIYLQKVFSRSNQWPMTNQWFVFTVDCQKHLLSHVKVICSSDESTCFVSNCGFDAYRRLRNRCLSSACVCNTQMFLHWLKTASVIQLFDKAN